MTHWTFRLASTFLTLLFLAWIGACKPGPDGKGYEENGPCLGLLFIHIGVQDKPVPDLEMVTRGCRRAGSRVFPSGGRDPENSVELHYVDINVLRKAYAIMEATPTTDDVVAPRSLGSFRIQSFDEGKHKVRYVDRESACRMLRELRVSALAADPALATSLKEMRDGTLACDTSMPMRRAR